MLATFRLWESACTVENNLSTTGPRTHFWTLSRLGNSNPDLASPILFRPDVSVLKLDHIRRRQVLTAVVQELYFPTIISNRSYICVHLELWDEFKLQLAVEAKGPLRKNTCSL